MGRAVLYNIFARISGPSAPVDGPKCVGYPRIGILTGKGYRKLMRNKKRKFFMNLSSIMVPILLSACGNSADVDEGSSASESTEYTATDNVATDKSAAGSIANTETPDNVPSSTGAMSESTGETIFSRPDTSKPRDITEVTIALPSSNLHDEPNEYYDRLISDINEYTGMKVTWKWYKSSNYEKQLEDDILNGNLADVVLIDRSEVFLQAMEDGLFWEIGPYIDDYDNLSTIPEVSRISASYNGKMYGIPRSSGVVGWGLGYRADWLEKLGLEEPTDWESFCEMLYAFTYNDPDGNGVDDTVGLLLDSYEWPWNVMESWFGVPNVWGADENGNLIHKSQTKEYLNAYKAFRELYAQGLINCGKNGVPGFKELPGRSVIRDGYMYSQGGCTIENFTNLVSVQNYFVQQGVTTEENLMIQLQASIDTGFGTLVLPINGTGASEGMLAISTDEVREEEHLKRILQFLNDISDATCSNLIIHGWEGVTYTLNEDGLVDESILYGKADDSLFSYRSGITEITTGFVAEENRRMLLSSSEVTPMTILRKQLNQENASNCVINYGYQFMSSAESEMLEKLDGFLYEAEMQYVTGEIDDAGFEAAINSWLENGGEELTQRLNEKYHAAGF